MATNLGKYKVTMEDGAEHEVEVDQRDWSKMEGQPFPEGAHITKTRFIVWNALTRNKTIKGGFTRFNEVDCVSVEALDDENDQGQEGEESGPPTS